MKTAFHLPVVESIANALGNDCSRRSCLRSVAGAALLLLSPGSRAAQGSVSRALHVERLRALLAHPQFDRKQTYRADVTIQILGVPLFRRRGVGGAVARLQRAVSTKGDAVSISFLAGSNPDQAGGVNRFGYIEEIVVERNGAPLEAAYLGLMTASPEDDFKSAKTALGEASKSQSFFKAIDGYLQGELSHSTEAAFLAPGAYTWQNLPPASNLLVQALADTSTHTKDNRVESRAEHDSSTFLYAVSRAMRQRAPQHRQHYHYHGFEFDLDTVCQPDLATGKTFAASKLVTDAEKVLRVDGYSSQRRANRKTSFTVWVDRDSPNALPLRFEFRPKSFLKVAFEATGNVTDETGQGRATPSAAHAMSSRKAVL